VGITSIGHRSHNRTSSSLEFSLVNDGQEEWSRWIDPPQKVLQEIALCTGHWLHQMLVQISISHAFMHGSPLQYNTVQTIISICYLRNITLQVSSTIPTLAPPFPPLQMKIFQQPFSYPMRLCIPESLSLPSPKLSISLPDQSISNAGFDAPPPFGNNSPTPKNCRPWYVRPPPQVSDCTSLPWTTGKFGNLDSQSCSLRTLPFVDAGGAAWWWRFLRWYAGHFRRVLFKLDV
jgi:hypothetical protein